MVLATITPLLLLLLAPSLTRGFKTTLPTLTRHRLNFLPLQSTSVAKDTHEEHSFLERMLSFIFEALPAAMTPFTEEMDETKIIKNPPKWVKPSSISQLRKKHHSDSLW